MVRFNGTDLLWGKFESIEGSPSTDRDGVVGKGKKPGELVQSQLAVADGSGNLESCALGIGDEAKCGFNQKYTTWTANSLCVSKKTE